MTRILAIGVLLAAVSIAGCRDPDAAPQTDTGTGTSMGMASESSTDTDAETGVDASTGTDSGTSSGATTDPDPGTDTDEAIEYALGLTRKLSWPGGGRELIVKVVDAEGGSIASDLSSDLSVELPMSSFEVQRVPLEPGYTAILIALPEDAAQTLQLVDDLKLFINERPASESIGLFVWRDWVEQLAGFGQSRERLLAQLDLLPSFEQPIALLPAENAAAAIEAQAVDIAGRAPRVMRAAVIAGADSFALSRPDSRVPVIVGLDGASQRIDTFAAESFYKVAICGGTEAAAGTVSVADTAGEALYFSVPATLPEEVESPCDLPLISAGDREYPDVLGMVFDPEQLLIYNQRIDSLSEEDFSLSVQVGDQGLAPAQAHLRGFSTLYGCARKSYTLQLEGAGRHFMPESRSDEFYLISMCQDERYIQMHTAYTLLSGLGIFTPKFRYIELRIAGESQGIYLLTEKMREEIVRDNSRVQGVMRRRVGWFEVKYGDITDSFYSLYLDTSQDLGTVGDHIDLDQYFRFMALMSAYHNGDYIDEIFIAAVEQTLPDKTVSSWFTMSAWDNDDLFSSCHNGGINAFVDTHQLAYCAESDLAHMLLGNPTTYETFVDALETLLLEEVTPDDFDAAIAETGARIMPYLAQPGISAAMVVLVSNNPAAIDPAIAQQDVQMHLDEMALEYRARHQLLLDRIALYRG